MKLRSGRDTNEEAVHYLLCDGCCRSFFLYEMIRHRVLMFCHKCYDRYIARPHVYQTDRPTLQENKNKLDEEFVITHEKEELEKHERVGVPIKYNPPKQPIIALPVVEPVIVNNPASIQVDPPTPSTGKPFSLPKPVEPGTFHPYICGVWQ